MLNTTTDLMTTLLACIAGISLVVGGIGIMNIMYVSVTERTREIGLRMSVGARGIDILSQFLIESVLISITGGLIGVILGCGASYIIKQWQTGRYMYSHGAYYFHLQYVHLLEFSSDGILPKRQHVLTL